MNAKEILAKVKGLFDAPVVVPPVAPVAPVAPLALATPVPTPFKLQDGSEITVSIADPSVSATPSVGDMVMIAGAPAPAADYTLDDGSILTVDATGMISVVVAPQPVTQPVFVAPPALTLEDRIKAIEVKINAPLTMSAIAGAPGLTTEMVKEMYDKFATGTTEDRIANLEVMIKALMECNFGYQIRQGQENEAIATYKNSLAPVQTVMAEQKAKLEAAEAKLTKQDGIIAGLFELVEKLVEEPTAAPKTLSENQKAKFERVNRKDERFKKIADQIKNQKALS